MAVNCAAENACYFADIYCPVTAGCSVYCDPDADEPCDTWTLSYSPIQIYLPDPDNLFDDSLLSISCESDCAFEHYFCENIADTTTCIHPLSITPLTCNATDSDCNVCLLQLTLYVLWK